MQMQEWFSMENLSGWEMKNHGMHPKTTWNVLLYQQWSSMFLSRYKLETHNNMNIIIKMDNQGYN